MRTFVIALLCFAVLACIIACNTVYIRKSSEQLSAILGRAAKESDPKPMLDELAALWESERYWIGFSVPFAELCSMDEHLCQMRIALEEGDLTEFRLVCGLALEVAERLGRLERFSWECIF